MTYHLEKTFGLREIHYVKPDDTLDGVAHPEHEPLQLSRPIRVVPHPDVKYTRCTLPHLLYIRTIETRVERNLVVCFVVQFVCDPVNLFHV